jgi:hypothetical protein
MNAKKLINHAHDDLYEAIKELSVFEKILEEYETSENPCVRLKESIYYLKQHISMMIN